MVPVAKPSMAKAQLAYMRNFDKWIRQPPPSFETGQMPFIRREYYNNENGKRHELSPMAHTQLFLLKRTEWYRNLMTIMNAFHAIAL